MNLPRPKAEEREAPSVRAIASLRDSDALLSIEDVAELLNLPVSWVYERTRRRGADRIPGYRLGKYWRFNKADVLAWLERQRSGARPNA